MRLLHDPYELEYTLTVIIAVVGLLLWYAVGRERGAGFALLAVLLQGTSALYRLVLHPFDLADPTVLSLVIYQTLRAGTWVGGLGLLWPHLARWGRWLLGSVAALGTLAYYGTILSYAMTGRGAPAPIGPVLEALFYGGLLLGSLALLRRYPWFRWIGLAALCWMVGILWFTARLPKVELVGPVMRLVALGLLLLLLRRPQVVPQEWPKQQ